MTKEQLQTGLTQLVLGGLKHLSPSLVSVSLMRFAAVAHLVGAGSAADFVQMAQGCYESELENQARVQQKGLG